jgi:hypothetical protein
MGFHRTWSGILETVLLALLVVQARGAGRARR